MSLRAVRSGLLAALLIPAAVAAMDNPDSGLDCPRESAIIAGRPEYTKPPITVECLARLTDKQSYNILVANETKASATHWELFTTPRDGLLTAYLPGRRPDHVRANTDIVDGKWHRIVMVMEDRRVRLYVDGEIKADYEVTPLEKEGIPGVLAVGALVTGELSCWGRIGSLSIIKGAKAPPKGPVGTSGIDPDTVGMWVFAPPVDGKFTDHSPLENAAALKRDTAWVYTGQQRIPGGMPTTLQPLPPPVDAAPLRHALEGIVARLDLQSVDCPAIRDNVLRAWSRELAGYGQRDYADSRPSGADPQAVREQAFDPHALIWEEDGGPVGTALRRTTALIARLRELGAGEPLEPVATDLAALRAAWDGEQSGQDAQVAQPYYLAACALRRKAALLNPVLDFDDILCVARGTFAGSVRSNPANADYQGGHFSTQYFGFNALPGGGLFIIKNYKDDPVAVNILEDSVVQNGRLKGRKLDHGAFATPDLSYDGKTVVFAWTENSEHRWTYSRKTAWHLFRVSIDGSGLTQLTDGPYSDFDPCWLPDGRIAFISERRGGHIRCFAAYLKVRNYTLFSMKPDGSDIVPLSYYETAEWNPSVDNDGRLVFTRWDYTDRENCLGTRIWISNPDGTDPRAPHGNYPHPYHTFPDHTPWGLYPNGREFDSRMGAPLVEMGIRAVPGSHKYICTAAPHHGEVYGSLAMLDLRVEDDGHMSQVRRVTPDEHFPETEMPGRRHYKYGTPWPLSEDFYLCNVWENLALVDRFGNTELLCELEALPCPQDERLRIIEPIPVKARPRPPAMPARTRQGKLATENAPKATVAVMNVYDSDLPFPPGTKIKWLRVTQNILKENHAMGEPMIGYERENTPRIPLGIVPVEQDGSAYFEAPVAKELIFQVLDENYMAVQSMRSVAFVHPGEQLSCVGCHEPKETAPGVPSKPRALLREPSQLQPEIGPIEPISYYRQIKPIFDNTCVKCHHAQGKGPQDMSYEALREDYTFWFAGAMYTDMANAYSGVHGGSRTIPGRFGARASKIGQALLNEEHRKAVSERDRRTVNLWLDSNSLRLGAYTREAAQMRGELVWPGLDVDPLNILGVEGHGRPLRGNFWHENLYGPHPVLLSEHAHDRVVILDAAGQIRWEYKIAHPQDAWMLPDGNVLIAWTHGVREVDRQGRTVWEYKTAPPNEIPNCQPLPEGKVLIGVVGECRLIEVDRTGKITHEVRLSTPVKEPHAQFRFCRKTPQGTYLVPFTAEGAVREVDRDGAIIREFPRRPMPVSAVRLDDGHTLITAGGAVTEYDANGAVCWELSPNDLADINVGTLAGVQRLENGNTIVCNWNTRDEGDLIGAHILEVTPDQRIVWQLTGDTVGQVAQCQLLTPEFGCRDKRVWR